MLGIAVYHINEVMTCRRNLSSKKVHYCRYSVPPPLTFGCTFLGYRTPTITVVGWATAASAPPKFFIKKLPTPIKKIFENLFFTFKKGKFV